MHIVQVSQTNNAAIKVDMYKAALETLVEVRREALGKAFTSDYNGKGIGAEVRLCVRCLLNNLSPFEPTLHAR